MTASEWENVESDEGRVGAVAGEILVIRSIWNSRIIRNTLGAGVGEIQMKMKS